MIVFVMYQWWNGYE